MSRTKRAYNDPHFLGMWWLRHPYKQFDRGSMYHDRVKEEGTSKRWLSKRRRRKMEKCLYMEIKNML
jgi:hypothetical protein